MGKKPFIGKNKGVTFRLMTKDEQSPYAIENPEINNVVDVDETEINEREKFGIYFNDNYNYLSHLKGREEPTEVGLESVNTIKLPVSAVRIPVAIAEVQGKEVALEFNDGVGPVESSAGVELDDDLLEAMGACEEGADMEGEFGDLEDDFLELAGGIDEPSKRRLFEQFRQTNPLDGDDGSDDGEMNEYDDDMEPAYSGLKIEPVSILKKAGEGGNGLDERFADFYENFDDNNDEEEDDYCEVEPEVDNDLLNQLYDDHYQEKETGLGVKPNNEVKRKTLSAYERQEQTEPETETILIPARKKCKFDCQSIVSTYSNTKNRPTIIAEEPRRKPKKEIKPVDVDMVDDDVMSMRSATSVSTFRAKNETTEERKLRKQAVKDERRSRREEKKSNQTAFKEERKKLNAQRSAVVVTGRRM